VILREFTLFTAVLMSLLKNNFGRIRLRPPTGWLRTKRLKSGQLKVEFCFIWQEKLHPAPEVMKLWKKWA